MKHKFQTKPSGKGKAPRLTIRSEEVASVAYWPQKGHSNVDVLLKSGMVVRIVSGEGDAELIFTAIDNESLMVPEGHLPMTVHSFRFLTGNFSDRYLTMT